MILLDTDHVTVLRYPENPQCAELTERIERTTREFFAITIVSVEEQTRGLLALIHRTREVDKQVPVYDRLAKLFDFFSRWHIVPFDLRASTEFKRLRKQGTRIGTMDLKIAAIALTRNARVLSANLRDFRQVPGLQVESWLG
jgi:tRNA(fMet)-specific endonuclease VapC